VTLSPAVLAASAVAIAGAVGAWAFVAGHAQDCAARWADSGLRVTYRDGQCLVEAGGRFYPERVIRVHVRQ
jgi:hypothetical protein